MQPAPRSAASDGSLHTSLDQPIMGGNRRPAALQNGQRFELERPAVERMDRLDRLKSDFFSTVSHELRTPLTAIQGMGLTLERSWADLDNDTRSEFIRAINEGSAALGKLVQQLLDLSDLDTGPALVHRRPGEGRAERARDPGQGQCHPDRTDGCPVVEGAGQAVPDARHGVAALHGRAIEAYRALGAHIARASIEAMHEIEPAQDSEVSRLVVVAELQAEGARRR